MRGTGTGRHGNGARHAQRTNDPPRSCVSACRVAPLYPVRSRSPPSGVRACVCARARAPRKRAASEGHEPLCRVCVCARARARIQVEVFRNALEPLYEAAEAARCVSRIEWFVFSLSLFFSSMEIWEYAGSVYTGGDGGIFFWTVDRSFVDRLLFDLKLVFRRKRERWDVRRQMFLFFFRCGKFYLGLFGIGLILVF